MKRIALLILLLFACPAVSQAHFLWLLTNKDSGKVQVFFGESAEPDDPDLLEKVANAEVWSVEGRGGPKLIAIKKVGDALEGDLAPSGTVILRHTFGVTGRGGENFLLKYYAKTYSDALPGNWRAVKDKERLPFEVTPEADGAATILRVTFNGQPQAKSLVTIVGPGIAKKIEGETDEKGLFRCELPQSGIYSIRAKHIEVAAGKHEDKEYKQIRHYSTLTLHHGLSRITPVVRSLPSIPKVPTSFGGAVVGDTLFAYGGNYGTAHEYFEQDQSGDLWTLDMAKPGEWRQSVGGPKLQGLAMVEHKGLLYRVGGFTAKNKSGEKQDLHSQNEFARFDPKTGKAWEPLPSLPEGRSSHDAAVIGDTLYVVGGWNMQGAGKDLKWHDTALKFDLAEGGKGSWKAIAAPPFKRRALALAAWQGKLYCIGGMGEKGTQTTEVAIYDPAQDSWTSGPSILGGAMDGFGSSAFASGNALYVTTISGSIQRLSADGKKWEFQGQLVHPRFFHRLLPWGDSKLVVLGGASMTEGKQESVEVLPLGEPTTARK